MDARGRHLLDRPATGTKGIGYAFDFLDFVQNMTGGSPTPTYAGSREPCSFFWESPLPGQGGTTLIEYFCQWASSFPGGITGTPNSLGEVPVLIGNPIVDGMECNPDPGPGNYIVFPTTPEGWASAIEYGIAQVEANCGQCAISNVVSQELGFADPDPCPGSYTSNVILNCASWYSC